MLFNSFIFILFLALVVPLFYAVPARARVFLLLCASYFFYSYWDWRFSSLLLISTCVDYWAGTRIHQSQDHLRKRLFLLLSIGVNLSLLGFFKYFGFFVDSFQSLCGTWGHELDVLHVQVILPVGISFYTFQTMSYTIDIYRGRLAPSRSFWRFALFVAFFPQLVAGPIERARKLLPQLTHLNGARGNQFKSGLVLIVLGLFKKVLIGDTAGRFVDHLFGQPELYQSPELLMGWILFSVQIYADFSGYSSIARGTARLLGIELMRNFEQPYLSSNITEFWRRWHISLSSWLRDYLYISLGGNRCGTGRTYLNLMITMLLGGLWHGANWTFVVWGGLHGMYLAIHKAMLNGKRPEVGYKHESLFGFLRYGIKVLCTQVMVLIAWLFFRANSFSAAFEYASRIINWQGNELALRSLQITTAFVLCTILLDAAESMTKRHDYPLLLPAWAPWGVCLPLIVAVFLYMATAEPMPFIYFQF